MKNEQPQGPGIHFSMFIVHSSLFISSPSKTLLVGRFALGALLFGNDPQDHLMIVARRASNRFRRDRLPGGRDRQRASVHAQALRDDRLMAGGAQRPPSAHPHDGQLHRGRDRR